MCKKAFTFMFAVVAALALAACDGPSELNEAYKGVPKNGQSCVDAYQLHRNVTLCQAEQSRH